MHHSIDRTLSDSFNFIVLPPRLRTAAIASLQWFQVVSMIGSLVVILDVTTSLIPWWWDLNYKIAPKTPTQLFFSLLLSLPGLYFLGKKNLKVLEHFESWSIPPVACWVLGTFLLLQWTHMALRSEHYPFSNIGMFSPIPVPQTKPTRARLAYFFEEGGTLEYLSFMREGDLLFHRYFPDLDYKTAWFLTFGVLLRNDAYANLSFELQEYAKHRPQVGYLRYRTSDTRIIGSRHRDIKDYSSVVLVDENK